MDKNILVPTIKKDWERAYGNGACANSVYQALAWARRWSGLRDYMHRIVVITITSSAKWEWSAIFTVL